MRLIFLGTPELAVPTLQRLLGDGHDVALVVSRADKRRGRGARLDPSPVKRAALDAGLTVTDQVEDAVAGAAGAAGAELGVVVAFGRLIRPHVLAALPMVNVHFSLLPRWRGAAPVERAILAGDTVTGVSVMQLDEGLDTGPVHAARAVEIDRGEHASELGSRLADEGASLLGDLLAAGLGRPYLQAGGATYAAKIEPAEHRLDWTLPAPHLDRVVRIDGSWTTFRGARLAVRRARPGPAGTGLGPGELDPGRGLVGTGGGGSLGLLEVQPEGRRPQAVTDWRNGARPAAGERLGADG